MNNAENEVKKTEDCEVCDGNGFLLVDNYGRAAQEAWTEVPCPNCKPKSERDE